MRADVSEALQELLARRSLSAAAMHTCIRAIMSGDTSEIETAALLTALRCKGEDVSEIVGAASAMRELASRIPCGPGDLLDTCGTGGDGSQTFNISTAAAIVAAAAGARVAKHGNRSVTSRTGSADVLEALGVCVSLPPLAVAQCIDTLGLGFCFSPLVHGAMKHAAPVRKELGFRTIFNLLGPLTNPAGANFQVVGHANMAMAEKLAHALAQLGTGHAFVVSGDGTIDEVCLWGETHVFEVRGGNVHHARLSAVHLGLAECQVESLRVDDALQSATVIRQVLAGEAGPARDMVLANTAAGLVVAGRAHDWRDGVQQAAAAIDTGAGREKLAALCQLTQSLRP